ncbi:MAG: zf-HC2 domain-containing protein [Nitrospirae bacterium]|nr:zf-HC2 domain-containing protein [Nitrospirota bacterium]
MKCQFAKESLNDYVDGLLKGEEAHAIEEHLATCAQCAEDVESMKLVIGKLRKLRKVNAPGGFVERLIIRTKATPESTARGWFKALAALPFNTRIPIGVAGAVASIAIAIVLIKVAPFKEILTTQSSVIVSETAAKKATEKTKEKAKERTKEKDAEKATEKASEKTMEQAITTQEPKVASPSSPFPEEKSAKVGAIKENSAKKRPNPIVKQKESEERHVNEQLYGQNGQIDKQTYEQPYEQREAANMPKKAATRKTPGKDEASVAPAVTAPALTTPAAAPMVAASKVISQKESVHLTLLVKLQESSLANNGSGSTPNGTNPNGAVTESDVKGSAFGGAGKPVPGKNEIGMVDGKEKSKDREARDSVSEEEGAKPASIDTPMPEAQAPVDGAKSAPAHESDSLSSKRKASNSGIRAHRMGAAPGAASGAAQNAPTPPSPSPVVPTYDESRVKLRVYTDTLNRIRDVAASLDGKVTYIAYTDDGRFPKSVTVELPSERLNAFVGKMNLIGIVKGNVPDTGYSGSINVKIEILSTR